jgi:F-type H+-transporting ATPase subunit epsilon
VSQEDSALFRLELVAPTGRVFEDDVRMVVLPATTGELGILAQHAPLVAQLSIGRMRVLKAGGEWVTFAVAEGFAKVQFDRVTVLADAAEEASQIDVDRVNKSVERANKRLEMHRLGTIPEGEDVDPYREQMALKRAHNRLKVAERPEK